MKKRLDEEGIEYEILLHLYTFGSKYNKNNETEKQTAEEALKKLIFDSYGGNCNITNIRVVRNVHASFFQAKFTNGFLENY